jgi:hypothetical protein
MWEMGAVTHQTGRCDAAHTSANRRLGLDAPALRLGPTRLLPLLTLGRAIDPTYSLMGSIDLLILTPEFRAGIFLKDRENGFV